MTLIARVFRLAANIGFYTFLAAHWYLVNTLHPHYALVGAALSYAVYRMLLPRIRLSLPPAALLLLTGALFYLMLNPLHSLRGMPQMLWLAGSAVGFRLGFAQLMNAKMKVGALAVSYAIFLALPYGLPRLGSTEPNAETGGPLDVVVVGAGLGGIAMGKELLDSGVTNFRIYEAAPEVGGTWWHNRYPGLHVDVQSSLYSYSFYPNPAWSRRWAPRDELLAYSISAADEFGVRPFIHFDTWVKSVRFNDDSGLWEVSLGERSVETRHLVLATGGLHKPSTPTFEGADTFAGTVFHSARWRDDVALANKRVAVIGSGASAVQILPEIAKVAAKVDMYQRTPNWVSPQDNREVSPLRKFVYAYVPLAYKLERLKTHAFSELGFRLIFPLESTRRAEVEEALSAYIRGAVEDETLVPKLIPDYEFGCKRPLVTGYFYPSLNRSNVSVITEGIDRLTPAGLLSHAGTERAYDVIIMATGYRVGELPFGIDGRQGQSLAGLWQDKPEAYESMMVHGFPNLYLMSGPNSGVFGSIIIHIESAANYIIQVIEEAADARLIEPTLEAQQLYNRNLQEGLQNTVWAGSCKSWYKLEDGHVVANNPNPISRIIYDRSRPKWEHFHIRERNQANQGQGG